MDCHEGKVAKAFAIGVVGGGYSLLARPIANASYRLVAPSNSEYSLFERIRYWSRTDLLFTSTLVGAIFSTAANTLPTRQRFMCTRNPHPRQVVISGVFLALLGPLLPRPHSSGYVPWICDKLPQLAHLTSCNSLLLGNVICGRS